MCSRASWTSRWSRSRRPRGEEPGTGCSRPCASSPPSCSSRPTSRTRSTERHLPPLLRARGSCARGVAVHGRAPVRERARRRLREHPRALWSGRRASDPCAAMRLLSGRARRPLLQVRAGRRASPRPSCCSSAVRSGTVSGWRRRSQPGSSRTRCSESRAARSVLAEARELSTRARGAGARSMDSLLPGLDRDTRRRDRDPDASTSRRARALHPSRASGSARRARCSARDQLRHGGRERPRKGVVRGGAVHLHRGGRPMGAGSVPHLSRQIAESSATNPASATSALPEGRRLLASVPRRDAAPVALVGQAGVLALATRPVPSRSSLLLPPFERGSAGSSRPSTERAWSDPGRGRRLRLAARPSGCGRKERASASTTQWRSRSVRRRHVPLRTPG